MRLTLQVFHELCLSRPEYRLICRRLSENLLRSLEPCTSQWTAGDLREEDGQLADETGKMAEPSVLPMLSPTQTLSIARLDTTVVAEQLCLMEASIFSLIKPRDLMQNLWNVARKGEHAASVASSIRHFNFISSWVVTRILGEAELADRARTLLKFMKIAVELRKANNFNSLMAVLSGISSSPILRLQKTYRLILGKKAFERYQVLEGLMSSERSFSAYRQALRVANPPCIPYLGVFLRDLFYLEEANKETTSDGGILLPKLLLMGDIVHTIEAFQMRTYTFQPDLEIQQYILNCRLVPNDEAYDLSLKLEARAPTQH
ncbi:ras guanine nucleotide exchange factor domain-containing protein [Zopfochytrium polystomum]|nr:ras guanine nucleotide exchange factor domain-containing protein [Zopfochytrium polystomum]